MHEVKELSSMSNSDQVLCLRIARMTREKPLSPTIKARIFAAVHAVTAWPTSARQGESITRLGLKKR